MRSHGRYLAGATALLGLVVAGTGCDTLPRYIGPGAAPPAQAEERVVSLGQPSASIPTRSFSIFRNAPRGGTAQAAPAHNCEHCAGASVVMLRPVPARAGENSVWSPVQRVSNEVPVVNTTAPAGDAMVRMELPQPIASTPVPQPEGGRLLPVPTPLSSGARVAVGPPPRKPAVPDRAATGYPDLPAAMITHPVDAPREGAKRALSAYVIEPPDVLRISGPARLINAPADFAGNHLVRPDGSIGFASFPAIFVAGMTIDQAKIAVARAIEATRKKTEDKPVTFDEILAELQLDVINYNSKFVYVVTDGGGYGEQVIRLPYTGNETVLDAIAQIQGLPAVASKSRIWVARATAHDHLEPNILPVDWCGITQRGSAATNYQLYPADRIYVNSDPKIRLDSRLAKILAPIERLFGITLLGSSTVNSIRSGNNQNFNNRGF